MYPICYRWVSGGYLQPEPTMYSRCFHWFPGPLAPSVMVNEVVDVAEEIELDGAATSKARGTRPNPSSRPSLRLAPLNLFPLLRLLPSTPSSSGILRLPPSRSHLRCPHHSTRALTKFCLLRGGLALHQPPRPSNVLRGLSVHLTLAPSRNALLQRMMRSCWIDLEMRTT